MTHGARRWRAARLTGTLTLALGAILVGMFGGGATTAWAHRLGGTPPPPFIDPSTGQINPQIVAETHNGSHTTVTYKDGAQVTDGTGIQ